MKVSVTLIQSDGSKDRTVINQIEDRECFSYLDHQNAKCEIAIQKNQFDLKRKAADHQVQLHLGENSYTSVQTEEGNLIFEVKTVDFNFNSDILVIRYIINDEERVIEIKYY